MKDLILEKYNTLTEFADKMGVTTQRLNYWIKKDSKLNSILYKHIIDNI